MGKWYNLEKIDANPDGGICASIVVPPNSLWFSGHFPGNPILPAIAQLAIVHDLVELACGRGVIPQTVNRVKFRRIIKPGEIVNIVVTPIKDNEMTYSFKLAVNGEMACKGSMKTAKSINIEGVSKN